VAFERVAGLDDLPEGAGHAVELGGEPLCLVRIGDEVRAIHDVCSHQEYPLHEGFVFGESIECALHGSTFGLRDGAPEALPATKPVPVYAAKVDGTDVYVDIDQQLNDAPVPRH
jgi:3-phenylpropionate/trans-cinnamate dioxygenase ferredoxin component